MNFGFKEVDGRLTTAVNKAISEILVKIPNRLDAVEASIFLRDIYDNATGIFDIGLRDKRPLHSVAMHDAEENSYNSVLYDALKRFKENRVFEHFGLNWKDAQELSHEEYEMILTLSANATRTDARKADNLFNDLETNSRGQKRL